MEQSTQTNIDIPLYERKICRPKGRPKGTSKSTEEEKKERTRMRSRLYYSLNVEKGKEKKAVRIPSKRILFNMVYLLTLLLFPNFHLKN